MIVLPIPEADMDLETKNSLIHAFQNMIANFFSVRKTTENH